MVDVINKKCEACNKTQATYGIEGDLATHCAPCGKLLGMVDVIHNKCVACKKTIPCYGIEGGPATHCAPCGKLVGMVNVVSKMCECGIRAWYGIVGGPATHCAPCGILLDMVNVVHKKCDHPDCNTIVSNPRYNKNGLEYCSRCFRDQFPDEVIVRNFRIKEKAMIDAIRRLRPDFNLIIDKGFMGSGKRPDVVIYVYEDDILIGYLMVEADENQHNGYDPDKDDARTTALFEAGGKPLAMIRVNTDGHTQDGVKVQSCFQVNKDDGVERLVDADRWEDKMQQLCHALDMILKSGFDWTGVWEERMFYDT
jgi:hypothetical protein